MRFLSRALFFITLLLPSAASASIISSLPYTFTNGSVADATQVNGNFNTIVTDVNANAATAGVNNNITSITGLTTPLASSYGGTVLYTGGTTGGSANAQTLATVVPSNFALTAGNVVTGIAGFTNTTAMTLAVNSLTAKNVKTEDGAGLHDPAANAVLTGNSYSFYYDGTEFILLNPSVVIGTILDPATALPNGVTATTQSASNNSTKVATTAYADAAVAAVPPAYNSISGFLPSSIAGTNTTGSMTISAGQAADSGNTVYITKSGTESWAVSNGNAINGYSGGTTLPNSSTIHMLECSGASGVGSYAIPNSSLSGFTASSCPTGYTTSFRRVFSFNTTGAGAPIAGTANEGPGGSEIFYLTTAVLDLNGVTPSNAACTAETITSVPLGIKVAPIFRANNNTTGTGVTIISSLDEPCAAPAAHNIGNYYNYFTAVPGYDSGDGGTGTSILAQGPLLTNTSGQINARQTAAGTNVLYWVTRGWMDPRRN